MDWHVRKREYSRTFKDGAGNVWGYMTAKELAKRYPNGGYRIVADLKKKENPSGDLSLTGEGKRTRLYAYNRKKKRTALPATLTSAVRTTRTVLSASARAMSYVE